MGVIALIYKEDESDAWDIDYADDIDSEYYDDEITFEEVLDLCDEA